MASSYQCKSVNIFCGQNVWFYFSVGDNDGMIIGRRYFQCTNKHGIFVRANCIRFIPLTRWYVSNNYIYLKSWIFFSYFLVLACLSTNFKRFLICFLWFSL